jgi:hypothetical protein
MAEVILQDFDYMQREPRQHALVKESTVVVQPLNKPIARKGAVEFNIPASEYFTSLHDATLHVKCKITKNNMVACDHAHATAADKVMPVNNVFHSIWSKVLVYVNGHVAEMADNYGYKAYLATLLSMDKAVMDVRGELTGWAKDTAGSMDATASDGANLGGRARGAMFASSRVVNLVGHLQSDIFMQGCSIPPGNAVKVVLHPAPDTFVLMAAKDSEYEMHVVDAELHVVRQAVAPSLTQAVARLTEKRNLKLNYRRTEVTMRNIMPLKTENVEVFAAGTALPDRILIGIVKNTAYSGQIESNPYNFLKLDYDSVQLTVDSKQYPSLPYKPEFGSTDPNYYPLYNSLLHEFNADKANHMINVTPNEYINGYTLFPFRLTPRSCSGDVLGEALTGGVTLTLTKKAEGTGTLTAIILSEYRSEYEICPVGAAASLALPQS